MTHSEDEEDAFLIFAMGRWWSPVGASVCHRQPGEGPAGAPPAGLCLEWEPYPETDPPCARAFARFLSSLAPPWHPIVAEFADGEFYGLDWPGRVGTDKEPPTPAIVLNLNYERPAASTEHRSGEGHSHGP